MTSKSTASHSGLSTLVRDRHKALNIANRSSLLSSVGS